MSNVGIFIYGTVVCALVATAVGLIVWGIFVERRSRLELERRQRHGEAHA